MRKHQFKSSNFIIKLYNLKIGKSIEYPGNAYQTVYKTRKLLEYYEEKSYTDYAVNECTRVILRLK